MKIFDEHDWRSLCELDVQKWCEMSSTANYILIANPMASTEKPTRIKEMARLVRKQSGIHHPRLTLRRPRILMPEGTALQYKIRHSHRMIDVLQPTLGLSGD